MAGLDKVESERARAEALAVASRERTLAFQPICDLRSGLPVGYEALSRFPEGPPEHWFTEAHRLGGGVDFERAVLVEAVSSRGAEWGYVSVNVSPQAVMSPWFVEFALGLPEPQRLVIELTEHTPVGDYDPLCAAVQRLRDGGLRVAVDDAGGGISSFRHILMVSPEIIKLDRSLIADLDVHAGRQALAEVLVTFAGRMGSQLVAEGIERHEELEACVRHGIHYGQGYLLGAPAPAPAGGTRDPLAAPQMASR